MVLQMSIKLIIFLSISKTDLVRIKKYSKHLNKVF